MQRKGLTSEDFLRIATWMFKYRDGRGFPQPDPDALEYAFKQAAAYVRGEEKFPASLDFDRLRLDFDHVNNSDRVRRIAWNGTKKTLETLAIGSSETGKEPFLKDMYDQLVPDTGGDYMHGPLRDAVLGLESLEKLAILLDGKKDIRPGEHNFRTQLIIPITNRLLQRELYDKIAALLKEYEQTELLQRGVKAVVYDQPELFKGVELSTSGGNLPQLLLKKNAGTSTSMIQKPDYVSAIPEFWEILTEVDGKPYGGVIENHNQGIVTTPSLPMALRLAQAAHQGSREAYRHALMYILNSP